MSRTRSLSRTLVAATAAAAPVVVLAPTAHAAPTTPLPRTPLGQLPTAPVAAKPVPAAPAPALPAVERTVTRWVSVPAANVRSGPSTSHRIVGVKTSGQQVKGTVAANGWIKISSDEFMSPTVLTDRAPATAPAASTSGEVVQYVTAGVGRVRSGPSLDHAVVGTRTYGTKVQGTWTNGWLKIGEGQYMGGSILSSTNPAGGGSTDPEPAPAPPASGTQVERWVNVPVANVRSGPGLNHRVVGTATSGTRLTGTSANGWVDLGNGRFISETVVTGTAPGGSSTDPAPAPAPAPPGDGGATQVRRWVSATAGANVRSGPSTSYAVVGGRAFGTEVRGTVTDNGWVQIGAGQFMSGAVLTDTDPRGSRSEDRPPAPAPEPTPGLTPLRQAIIDTAAMYVGYPYVLYGTPPEAFDCSAYTWWVYKQQGITIPRTVRDQKTFVTRVTDPQPGDLIFYDDFYHVGIYAGPGMTYEALNPGAGVRYGAPVSTKIWYGRVPGL